MSKIIIAFTFLLYLNSLGLGQVLGGSETNWERYAFQNQGFSVSLPKLPVIVNNGNWKISEETERFGAYSSGVAYVVSYSQESKDKSQKDPEQMPFSKNNFQLRIAEIKKEFETRQERFDESESSENRWEVTKFAGATTIYKVYYNPKNKSWIELWAIEPNESKTEVENFFLSLKFEKNPQGKETGSGATAIIGDLMPVISANSVGSGISNEASLPGMRNELPKTLNENQKVEIKKLRIVLKPRANYTEEARKSQISGTVRVRATFSANGSVSGVSAINGLPYGLTEQAISAARKILFVPEKHNGVRVSINRVIEYNFNLY